LDTVAAFIVVLLIVAWCGWEWWPIREARRMNGHLRAEGSRLAELDAQYLRSAGDAPHWYAVNRVGLGRLDVVGGNSYSWRQLLAHVCWSSPAATCVVDLSRYGQWPSEPTLFEAPSCFAQFDPLIAQPAPAQVVAEVIAVSSEFSRDDDADRAVLAAMDSVLAGQWSLPRLAGALAAFVGEHVSRNLRASYLTTDELRLAFDYSSSNLMPDGGLEAARRIYSIVDSFLGAGLGTTSALPAAIPWFRQRPTVVTTQVPHATEQQLRRLAAMIVASISGHIVAADSSPGCRLAVFGADRLGRVQLDALAAACSNNGVELITAFEYFGGEALNFVGSGAANTVFFRAATAQEGEEAARLIGKEHVFVLDSTARQSGVSATATDGFSTGLNTTRTSTSGSNRSTSTTSLFDPNRLTRGQSSSAAFSVGRTSTRSQSIARGESESHTDTIKRSEEFVVHPQTLMSLPPTAFIYRVVHQNGVYTVLGDCDLAITASTRATNLPRYDDNSWWTRALGHPDHAWCM